MKVTAREADLDVLRAEGGGDGHGARSRRLRLPHATLPDARLDRLVVDPAGDLDVRALGEVRVGLEEFASLPPEEAVEAVIVATRKLASYQRKWLRRLPSAVTLASERAPEELADEILALAGTGKRLPRR